MDVKCPGCYKITTVFSHAQTVVLCVGCSTVLCQPTGGRARLTEGNFFNNILFRFQLSKKCARKVPTDLIVIVEELVQEESA